MGKYTGKDAKIEFDNSSGVLQDMTAYITAAGAVKITAETQDITPLGSTGAWMQKLFAGLRSGDNITLEGFYDDTASTGPDAVFNDVGCVATATGTRTLKVTYGSTKSTSWECIIKSYDRNAVKGELTKYTVELELTGAPTET